MPKCHNCGAIQIKKPRAPSEYNLFVQEMMKDEDIRKLGHQDRMRECGRLWGLLKEPKAAASPVAVVATKKAKTKKRKVVPKVEEDQE